jgi:hypothetical protein
VAAPSDFPVSERVEFGVGQIRLDAAQLGPSADPYDRDDLVFCCLDQLDGLEPEIVERVEPVLDEARRASFPWIGPWSSGAPSAAR